MPNKLNFIDIVGPHPLAPDPFGIHFGATDEHSNYGVPHRILNYSPTRCDEFEDIMRQWLVTHHASPDNIERDRKRREALIRQGFVDVGHRFPINPNTQKGNWAEIFLAEYLVCSCDAQLPIYRLRYNTNIEQSMKGDDVLAFDLDSKPVRILVGEAKFRSSPSKKAVIEIVEALTKSHKAGIPVSLQFVADRLFQEGNGELGSKVDECNSLFAMNRIQLDHVGLLVSDANAAHHVQRNAKSTLHRLAMISVGLTTPEDTVSACYLDIEEQV